MVEQNHMIKWFDSNHMGSMCINFGNSQSEMKIEFILLKLVSNILRKVNIKFILQHRHQQKTWRKQQVEEKWRNLIHGRFHWMKRLSTLSQYQHITKNITSGTLDLFQHPIVLITQMLFDSLKQLHSTLPSGPNHHLDWSSSSRTTTRIEFLIPSKILHKKSFAESKSSESRNIFSHWQNWSYW